MSSTMAPNVDGVVTGRRTVYSMCSMCSVVRYPIEVTVEDGRAGRC